jgi:hypothetical protein
MRRGPLLPSNRFQDVSSTIFFLFRGSITRPIDSLSTLRSRGHPRTTQDSLPTRWLGFGRTGLSPAGLFIEFQGGIGSPIPFEPGFADARKPGKQKPGTPKGAARSRGATKGGPRERGETKVLGPGEARKENGRASGRTAACAATAARRQRLKPMSLSGAGRTRSRPLASRVTMTDLPCEGRRAAVARNRTKRWPSETTT